MINISCVKDVDIKQIEGSVFQIPSTIALVKLDLTQHDFLDENNQEVPKFEELFLINLEGIFYESTTDSLELVTQFTNTFDRNFIYYLEFLDSHNQLLMVTQRRIVQALGSPVIHTQDFEGEEFENITNARRINVRIFMEDGGEILDPFEDRELKMQSVINYMFELEMPNF